MLPRPLQAVIFDMDGLLVDTEGPFRDAMLAAAGGMGLELPQEVFFRMVGGNGANSDRVLRDHFGPAFDLDAFWLRCRSRVHEIFEAGVALKAGVVELLDALEAAGKGRTVVAIAHRLSTVRDADVIFVLDKGSVVASGTHAQLMKKSKLYAGLAALQLRG